MKKICIVEDDQKIREELSIFLQNNGYETTVIENFENTVESIMYTNSDLILLDLNLPKYDGHYICKQLRKASAIPIIVVTSKNTELDELMSLNLGADNFITKPYQLVILMAHIEAIFKRISGNNSDVISYEGYTLDISKSILYYEKQQVELTKNELKIVHFLFKNAGRIITREEMMEHLWDSAMYVDDNTLTVNMNRVRRKLEEISSKNIIDTKRGLGYIIQ